MDEGNNVWLSYQAKIKEYVESIGGNAVIGKNDYNRPLYEKLQSSIGGQATKNNPVYPNPRPDYDKLADVLSGQLPISEYNGCN